MATQDHKNKPSDIEIYQSIEKMSADIDGSFDCTEQNRCYFDQLIHRDLIIPQEIVDWQKIKADQERKTAVTQKIVNLLKNLDKSINTTTLLKPAQDYLNWIDSDLGQSRILGYVTNEQIQKYGVEYGMQHMRVKENMIITQDLRTGETSEQQQTMEENTPKFEPKVLKSNPLLDSDPDIP